MSKNRQRKLTSEEIENILSFIVPNPYIPKDVGVTIAETQKKGLRDQLKQITIFPKLIKDLKKSIEYNYNKTLIEPGESVGVICAQSIGEKQTQGNLNTFHKAGSADKQPTVSKILELLSATNKPKNPTFFIYLNDNNDTVQNVRKTIEKKILHITIKKVLKSFDIYMNKEDEEWYGLFSILEDVEKKYDHCLVLNFDMDLLFEYKIKLKDIAEVIEKEYIDSQCIYSPDNYATIHVYFDTNTISIPDDSISYVNEDNFIYIYLEEVALRNIETLTICGIPGIVNTFFLKQGDEWIIETENLSEKSMAKKKKKKGGKTDAPVKRYKNILALDCVDYTRTISNNVWDIYHTLGIEATREYLIQQFSQNMDGINRCHISLLSDKMTSNGTIASISRYSMRNEGSGPFTKASFEEPLDNFLKACIFGQEEPVKGVSVSIICGKKPSIGTNLSQLSLDIEKLL